MMAGAPPPHDAADSEYGRVDDVYWMRRALAMARQANESGEVPVGAVLCRGAELLGVGHNRPIGDCDPSAHAEVIALRDAAARSGNYRLPGTTLYVTLEPCAMCVGALVHARVARCVYAAGDPKSGACGGAFDLCNAAGFNHRIAFHGGVLGDECGALLREFFRSRR